MLSGGARPEEACALRRSLSSGVMHTTLLVMLIVTPTGTIWARLLGAAAMATMPGIIAIASMSISSLARSSGGWMRCRLPTMIAAAIRGETRRVAGHLILS